MRTLRFWLWLARFVCPAALYDTGRLRHRPGGGGVPPHRRPPGTLVRPERGARARGACQHLQLATSMALYLRSTSPPPLRLLGGANGGANVLSTNALLGNLAAVLYFCSLVSYSVSLFAESSCSTSWLVVQLICRSLSSLMHALTLHRVVVVHSMRVLLAVVAK